MYRNKKDVDKHVENLLTKLSAKEFKTRAYSVARLYYEVGDYVNCQKYVEQYLTQKDNNAAAYKLLGQALQKLGQKEKALEQYKTSLDIDPSQISTILDICELLADVELVIEPGRAKYWCEKAEATFPRHPVTFRLRERLVTMSNPDPEALVNLLTAELAIRPKDALLHVRLLKHYLQTNQYKEAFEHSSNIEFSRNNFLNSYTWYEALCELLNHNSHNINDWLYQLLLLTVRERICVLSLTETPTGSSKSLIESNEFLHAYDQALESVAKAGATPGFGEFHASLLHHHRGQFTFHAATFLLKKAKKDQLNWRDATKYAAPLMLIAWHTAPSDTKVNWLRQAPEKQLHAVNRWYSEGTYRCSQAGHYILSNVQDKRHMFIDQISQCCSDTHWRDKLYEKIFTARSHLTKIKNSHLVSNAFNSPILRLPRKIEVEAYDGDAQKQNGNSLHHIVWTLLNYKNFADFKCTLFDMLQPCMSSSGPETLNKLDIHAFLYSAALTARQKRNEILYIQGDRPTVLPANITDLLCPLPQMKWWDCAYKFCQNELGTELTDIRATLSRGIEVVRCIDNHGLDPELLCHLGRIFSEQAKIATGVDEKNNLQVRAGLYYASAIPLLDKLKNKLVVKLPEKRIFDYTHKEIGTKELNSLIEESKLYVAMNHFIDGEYERSISILSNLKSPQAYYHISQSYQKIALEEHNSSTGSVEIKAKYAALLSKAKTFAYKALDRLKESETNENHPLFSDIHGLIENIEIQLNKLDPDISGNIINDGEGKYFSDENLSTLNEYIPGKMNSRVYRNLSSTPKPTPNRNNTNYRTAVDTQYLESTHGDQQFLERIEKEIKNLQKRDTIINDFMEQTKDWFLENRQLGNQITTINTNIQNTTDQFKLLKISMDQVKGQIDEVRSECKDVGELKKQVAELKKEINKLKKSSEQALDESELYNLDEEYRTNDSATNFQAPHLPFTPPQVMPPFNQRLVPPFPVPANPYQFYGQSLYNLCNQYSQLAQSSSVAGAAPLFDPTRPHLNYPGVYASPEQMYLDVAHLVPPNMPVAPTIPVAPSIPAAPVAPTLPSVPTMSNIPATTNIPNKSKAIDTKEISRSLPENVVITSSDPLPICTTSAAPILSVTIPSKHIKGTPHNYQIAMPSSNSTKAVSPPVFSFSMPGNPSNMTTIASPLSTWNQSNIFKTEPATVSSANTLYGSKFGGDMHDESKTVVDGVFSASSPNNSLNKSRTLSERSNTSVENYDPCPDFKPIVPLPAEVKVMTGEENEITIFSSRAKLFRFSSKQWKERGLGEMKLLKHKLTGKVRVLMRREQVHKICANHIITPEMEITPMKNETKAYFWVANDFAEEVVVLEKFCVRFKTADIAKEFYDIFENARQESATLLNTSNDKNDTNTLSCTQLNPNVKDQDLSTSVNKAVIGGFTFSSTPTLKTVIDNTNPEPNILETPTSKVNVFSGLSFKTTSSSPFSNLFGPSSVQSVASTTTNTQETPHKLNTSDAVEEFEPNVEFKPVIPLPALVDQKTGEEDENILFEHRAKLLRFEVSTKEWKERGLGNIKLLVNKDNVQKLRLLMRREQIMKVCCNHAVTRDMVFQKMPNMDKAVTWCAKDFSEGELVAETFCLRFKTVKTCEEFMDAVKTAQTKLMDDKAAKEEQNAAKQIIVTKSTTSTTTGWGDAFKPKPGSWECKECFIRNEVHLDSCTACNSPKDPSKGKSEAKPTAVKVTDFKYGIAAPTVQVKSGWGDKFKPKEGTWECQQCLVRNESNVDQCSACNSSKDPTAIKQEHKSIFGNAAGSNFKFGIPTSANPELKPKSNTASIFDGTGAHKFSFGIPSNTSSQNIATFGEQIPPTPTIIEAPKTDGDKPLNFSVKRDENNAFNTPVKPALLPTPHFDNTPNTTFGANESGTFGFVFKPKTPTKGKSPVKSPKNEGEDDSDGNEYVSDDDGVHIHFSPVVPMPEKVQVVTGEEDEIELYGHRAKLFRFLSGEWKERGIGVIKILKHKDTGKLRVVMRREQVLKICLNHALTCDVTYTPKDDKAWHFVANDFSEGELSLQHFCIRFKTKEIALEFKDAVDKARSGKSDLDASTATVRSNLTDTDSNDVIFVSEIQATLEEKQKAKELKLPENFFTYKSREPCRGCRGCMDEDVTKDETVISRASVLQNTGTSTPIKSTAFSFQTPINSAYGTPTSLEKTVDTSIFRTPLTSIGSNTKTATPCSASSATDSDSIDKENTLTNNSSIFGGFGEQNTTLGTPQSKPGSIFGAGDTTVSISGKTSVLAPPKLSSVNTSAETQDPNTKSIFGTTQSKSIFSDAKPIFGDTKSIFGNTNSNTGNQTNEFKSVFGTDSQKPVNFFSGVSQGSIFGPGALNNSSKPTTGIFGTTISAFGSGASQNSVFGTGVTQIQPPDTNTAQGIFGGGKSIFGNAGNQTSIWNTSTNKEVKTPEIAANTATTHTNEIKDETAVKDNIFNVDNKLSFASLSTTGSIWNTSSIKEQKNLVIAANTPPNQVSEIKDQTAEKETLFNIDNKLSFAALSTTGPGEGFSIEKKPDFRWEGAGQQLFGVQKSSNKEAGNNSTNESGAVDDSGAAGPDEEYDPHYEPIVPLPDKIVVTTGEEDEEKLFGERCKLYRYDEKTREWKERGVGEMKILYHPNKNTYRLLLRREQVHKAVLNMLLFADLELLPMKNSDRAWTWAGRNFAEASGNQETLAVRFKSVDLATAFQLKVVDCVRKIQAAAAQAIREEKESGDKFESVAPLRLPKHLEDSARADNIVGQAVGAASAQPAAIIKPNPNGEVNKSAATSEMFKQVQFQEPEGEDVGDGDEEDDEYKHDDYDNHDYDAYYNEEEEESAAYYSCDGEAVVRDGATEAVCPHAHIQVLFDQELYSPKIFVTDSVTGEILADMIIHTDTEFQMSGDTCSWSGKDYTRNDPVFKTVSVNFYDSDTALQFYDSCETSKAAAYSSTDPES